MTRTQPTPKGEGKWPHANWKVVYLRFWKAPVPKKWNVTYWLLLRHSHYLGEKAEKQNWNGIPHNCTQCQTLETHSHLFIDCPKAKMIWDWIRVTWSKISQAPCPPITTALIGEAGAYTPNRFKNSKDFRPIWQSLLRTAIHSIWQARCEEIFGDIINPNTTLPIFKNNLKTLITYQLHSPKYKHLFNLWSTRKTICYFSPHNSIIFLF